MKLKSKIEDRAWQLTDTLAAQARTKYIEWIMKEEDVDFETALALATGKTDPIEYEFTLGYKLADPIIQMAMAAQPGRKNREAAVAAFEATLDPEELRLFRESYGLEARKKFKHQLKDEKAKNHKSDE